MDLQKILDNAVQTQRAEKFNNSPQLSLGELILKLEAIPLSPKKKYESEELIDREVAFGMDGVYPTHYMSWRGIYRELALGFTTDDSTRPVLSQFIKDTKECMGKTFEGYKGGDFVMGKTTPVWVANYGNSENNALIDVEYDDYEVRLITKRLES